MTEEEYFRKNYPDSCYGDKPLSPHWDFFQDGVEFGERQSEKKIEKLKTEAKAIMNIAIEGIKYWGIVGGNERPLEKQAEMLFNLFLDKAEQFLKEIEK